MNISTLDYNRQIIVGIEILSGHSSPTEPELIRRAYVCGCLLPCNVVFGSVQCVSHRRENLDQSDTARRPGNDGNEPVAA